MVRPDRVQIDFQIRAARRRGARGARAQNLDVGDVAPAIPARARARKTIAQRTSCARGARQTESISRA